MINSKAAWISAWSCRRRESGSSVAARYGVQHQFEETTSEDPTMVSKSAPLAQTMGVPNAVSIDGDAAANPPSSARAPAATRPLRLSPQTSSTSRADCACRRSAPGRLARRRRPGADAAPRRRLLRAPRGRRPARRWARSRREWAADDLLEAIMQKRASKEAAAAGVVPVVLMTHGTTEASIRDALAHAPRLGSRHIHRKNRLSRPKRCSTPLNPYSKMSVCGREPASSKDR